MNTEKKDDNIYTKQLDVMDSYLLNIIKRFFDTNPETIADSAESIIIEAVTRAKKEISLDGRYGVSSVNGMSGAVTIVPGNIGAEPAILYKENGFNKPFGHMANTICEGNDIRLSDARVPLPHSHLEYAVYTSIFPYLLTTEQITKLNSLSNYVHPATHPASMISQDTSHRFATDSEKLYWNSKQNVLPAATTSVDGYMTKTQVAELAALRANFSSLPPRYVHPTGEGYNHIPTGGTTGQILGWKQSGEAQWVDLDNSDTDIVTFEAMRIKKRGVCTLTLAAGVNSLDAQIDLSTINFYNAPTYSAYYINDDGTKEQIPTIILNATMDVSEAIKAYIDSSKFKISIMRKDSTLLKVYKIYFEIMDVDNSVTISRAKSINVLNIYPGTVGTTYTFTNWKGDTYTLPVTAQVKRWMEEPNDESPKGYGQGLIAIDCVDVDAFNINPYSYLKDSSGNWKYDTVYFGTWDSNNGKGYSTAGIAAISELIAAGRGYISGHDTPWAPFATAMGMTTYNTPCVVCSEIKVKKAGLVSSFPWNLGDINTSLFVPPSHVSSQFHTGDVWFKYNYPSTFIEVNNVGGISGTNNFYLGTYNNTAFIQAGHTSGAASADEQKILANVFYYLANKGV